MSTTVRLHITPLTQETTESLLPPNILADKDVVASMSFHTIPSFPEKSYGYLDCDRDVATGIKKKLNGSTFRGVKVRVEDARADRFTPGGVPETKKGKKEKRKREKKDDEGKKSKKNMGDEGVIKGIGLADRKVQRGWSRPPAIASPAKSDSKRECLFKTSSKKGEKSKKGENTVREFTHNTKFPQFLKGASLDGTEISSVTSVFDEARGGWLNAASELIEPVLIKSTTITTANMPETYRGSNTGSGSSSGSDMEPETSPVAAATPQSPSTKCAKTPIPTLQITIPRIVHPLEALYNPTTSTPYSSAVSPRNTFRFGFAASNEGTDEEDQPTLNLPSTTRYRSTAPTPDTAIGTCKFFPPGEQDLPEPSGGQIFEPSTPCVVGSAPEDLRMSMSTPMSAETPLLGAHEDSRFLGALNVWGKVPLSKTLGEGEEDGELVEKWRETFYQRRGEWNREWRRRRREVGKRGRFAV